MEAIYQGVLMPVLPLPIRGPTNPSTCIKETTGEFLRRRAELGPNLGRVVEQIVESFDRRPTTFGDIEFPGTQIGTVHARIRQGVYVLYQQFTADRRATLIKLWYCGTCDGGRFDFEDQEAGESTDL